MIVLPRPSALRLLFTLKGSVVPRIAPRLLAILVLSAAVTACHRSAPHLLPETSPVPFTLLGLALSIFLGFRNNACYERWWEARRQWGQLIAETRSTVRDLVTLLPDRAAARRAGFRVIAFAHALRNQLRGGGNGETERWLPEADRGEPQRA